jgi:hypothetical protein
MLIVTVPEETLLGAATRMRWYQVGALPVYRKHRLVGILTERDVIAAVADGVDPATTRVADYMTDRPVIIDADEGLEVAARRMATLGMRHLPVIGDGRQLGMLSIRDLLAPTVHADGDAPSEEPSRPSPPSAGGPRQPTRGTADDRIDQASILAVWRGVSAALAVSGATRPWAAVAATSLELEKYLQLGPLPDNGIVVAQQSGPTQYTFTQTQIARQLHPNLPATPLWAYDDGSGLGGQAAGGRSSTVPPDRSTSSRGPAPGSHRR